MSKPYLAIVAIARDEADYIDEWIAYHELVGVEHFYIYNNDSTDGTGELLAARRNVTVIDWPGQYQQFAAYTDGLVRGRGQWLAFIDVDEFLFSPTYEPVPMVLRDFERHDSVGACWAVFGTSGHQTQPDGGVLSNYTHRAPFVDPVHKHVKTIVQPSRIPHQRNNNAHFWTVANTVDMHERRIEGPFAGSPVWDRLRLNHYWSKSVQEMQVRNARPRADAALTRGGGMDAEGSLSSVLDETMLPYVPLVAGRLAA